MDLPDQVPDEAVRLHQEGREAGTAGDTARSLALFHRAHELAPAWPYPAYDMAFTYLLAGRLEQAERWYAFVDHVAPRGFFTAKTALHTVRRERRGELAPGLAKAFALLEWEPPETRRAALQQLTQQHPSFSAAWRDLAAISDGDDVRLPMLEQGLAGDADDETYGVLLLNKVLILNRRGQRAEAAALVDDLLRGPRCTAAAETLATAMRAQLG